MNVRLNFYVATFNSAACSDQLRLVTHILAGGVSTIDNSSEYRASRATRPITRAQKCSSTRGNILHDHHRMFSALGTSKPVSSLEFSHFDVTERLIHVLLLAASLEASTNKLQ